MCLRGKLACALPPPARVSSCTRVSVCGPLPASELPVRSCGWPTTGAWRALFNGLEHARGGLKQVAGQRSDKLSSGHSWLALCGRLFAFVQFVARLPLDFGAKCQAERIFQSGRPLGWTTVAVGQPASGKQLPTRDTDPNSCSIALDTTASLWALFARGPKQTNSLQLSSVQFSSVQFSSFQPSPSQSSSTRAN